MARDRASACAPRAASKRQRRSAAVSTNAAAPPLPAPLAPGAAHDLAALPSAILKLIFAYACDRVNGRMYFPDQLIPRKPVSLHRSMPHLLTVCKAWSHAVADIVDEFIASTHTVRFQTAKRKELTEVLRALEAKGDSVRDLRVWFGASYWNDYRDHKGPKRFFESVEKIKIDWRRVFASCPHLVRLDLSLVPLNSRHILEILDAASTLCRDLQALILPNEQGVWEVMRRPDFDGVTDHLYHALRRWHGYQGPTGGLLQLSVPKCQDFILENEFAHPDKYLENVARFCPNIQHLHDWRTRTQICLPLLPTWHNFFKTCARLHGFDWSLVPLNNDTLGIFAAHPKLELKKLVFACETFADPYYLPQVFGREGDIEITPNWIAKAIAACPALEELYFELDVNLLLECVMLHDALNDNVLLAVSQSCPNLKRLTIAEWAASGIAELLDGITDAGLIAISRLPKLEHVAMKQTNASAEGILALIQNAPDPQLKRRVVMTLGCQEDYDHRCFFEELEEFMELLLQLPGNLFQGHRFELELQVRKVVEPKPPEWMIKKFIALAKRVMARHSSVGVHFTKICHPALEPPTTLSEVQQVFFISPRGMAGCVGEAFEDPWF